MIHKNEMIIVICSAVFLVAGLTLILILTNNMALTVMDRETANLFAIEAVNVKTLEENEAVDAKPFEENGDVDIEEFEIISHETDGDVTGNKSDEIDHVLIINNEDKSSEVDKSDSESIESSEAKSEEGNEEALKVDEEIVFEIPEIEEDPEVKVTAVEIVEPIIIGSDEETEEEQFKKEMIEVVQELAEINLEEEEIPFEHALEIVSVPSGAGVATAISNEGFRVTGGTLTASGSGSNLVYELEGEYAVITFSKTMYTGIGEIFVDNRFIKSVDTNSNVNEGNQVKTVQVDFRGKRVVELKIVSAIGFGQELNVQSVIVYD